ncbi:helix-turn-helix domain-containing protein [Sphingobacterium athyrii]|uniref:HTH cro/C1-type domain-containing protein n=1 Tax=Sphingobacterium athyrii TaxID=2152717 RepID=A0A363NWS2_9SPHI|nr:helix-turn-helix transcriptional regulator [Sphingobacterium athyrii]PUV25163.1 hypothetical protein DCO56_09500 [Sphingobacterium athyrii]
MSNEKRSERIKSPDYRVFIGKNLRSHRIDHGYTLKDIKEMTGIPINTLIDIEKGEVTNIDYYVEYAKSVNYPLANLKQANIILEPLNKLSNESLKRIKLTKEIRKHIILTEYISDGLTTNDIIEELVRKKVIKKGEVTSTEVSGVMRNLAADNIVEVESKTGNKNTYILKK